MMMTFALNLFVDYLVILRGDTGSDRHHTDCIGCEPMMVIDGVKMTCISATKESSFLLKVEARKLPGQGPRGGVRCT